MSIWNAPSDRDYYGEPERETCPDCYQPSSMCACEPPDENEIDASNLRLWKERINNVSYM